MKSPTCGRRCLAACSQARPCRCSIAAHIPRPARRRSGAELHRHEPAILDRAQCRDPRGRCSLSASVLGGGAAWRIGGRLVCDHRGERARPDHKAWRDGFVRLQERARVVFTATIAGSVFAPHGTSVETRLTVIDKVPADDPAAVCGIAWCWPPDLATLLRWLTDNLPPRQPIAASACQPLSTPRRTHSHHNGRVEAAIGSSSGHRSHPACRSSTN
jgi:hypothetical protein